MKLYIDLKPSHSTAPTKEELIRKITRGHARSFGSFGDGYIRLTRGQDEFIRVFNLEKHRAKKKRIDAPKPGGCKTKVLSVPRWEAWVYDVPVSYLMLTKQAVKQQARNFVMTKR